MLRHQLNQRALFCKRHRAAQRILEIGHHPHGLRRMPRDRAFECRQVDAFARIGRHFDRAQAQAFERLQAHVETRRFHHYRIARPAHRRQAQVQRFHRAVGDEDLVGIELHAVERITQRDLPPQFEMAGREFVDGAPRIHVRGRAGEHAPHALERKQQRARKGGAQRHHFARHRRTQHCRHHLADLDRTRFAIGRRCGLRFRGQRARRIGNVVARARARMDQALRFQQVIGLEDGGRAQFPAGAGLAHRRQPVAGLEQPVADRRGDVGGQGFVALHGQLIWFFARNLSLPNLIWPA